MSSPARDFPTCQHCGRKLSLVIPGDGRNAYYECTCVGKWPYPKCIASDTDVVSEEID